MTIISSKIGEMILRNHPQIQDLARAMKTILMEVKEAAEAVTEGSHEGIVYSNSLEMDGTDNIYYSLHVGRTSDRSDFYAELRFVHNATQLFTGIIVAPADVQAPGETTGTYAVQYVNNITFPRHYTHLLYQAITEANTEMAGGLSSLENVATLLI